MNSVIPGLEQDTEGPTIRKGVTLVIGAMVDVVC